MANYRGIFISKLLLNVYTINYSKLLISTESSENMENVDSSFLNEEKLPSQRGQRPGRPKGTKKPDDIKRKPISMRFSQEILQILDDGIEGVENPIFSSKTDFVERAVRHYHHKLLAASPLKEGSVPESEQDQDFVDKAMQSWKRERPGQEEELFSCYAVFGRILRASQFLDIAEARITSPYGLSESEFRLLSTLRRSEAPYRLTPTQLIESLLITPGGVTKQVDRLKKLGLVNRFRDSNDRRSVLVGLTKKGIELLDEINMSSREGSMYKHVSKSLSPDEQRVMARLLRKLLRSLES